MIFPLAVNLPHGFGLDCKPLSVFYIMQVATVIMGIYQFHHRQP
ncbi:MAG: hypothetical protein WDM76_02065 [Limisphaerales bacterium]